MALGLSLMVMVTVVRDNWRVPFFDALMTVIGVIYTPMVRVAYVAGVIWTRSELPIRIQLSAHRRLCDCYCESPISGGGFASKTILR
jgi:hypothetical protein